MGAIGAILFSLPFPLDSLVEFILILYKVKQPLFFFQYVQYRDDQNSEADGLVGILCESPTLHRSF